MTARMMSPALLVFTLVTEVSLHKAPSSSFSSRCQALVRSWTRWSRPRVYSRSSRISAGGTKLGRSRPISASRASHWASSRPVFGRPASCLAWEEFASVTASPCASST